MPNAAAILTTERLLLRAFQLEDASSFYELNLDEEVMRYTGDVAFESIEATELFIQNYDAYRKSGFGRWTVLSRDTLTCLGWCGLKQHPDGMVDLGYRFHRRYWNKGYATEAAKSCLKYGFEVLELSEIVGRTAKNNAASIRVLEKIGMTFWKEAPCEGIQNSVYYKAFAPCK